MTDTAIDPAVSRPGVFSLVIRSKASLYAAWIPLLRGGGLFVPSTREHRLGEEVLVLLSLLDDNAKIPIHGHVAWVNPAACGEQPPAGVRRAAAGKRHLPRAQEARRGPARRGHGVVPADPHGLSGAAARAARR